MIRPAIDMRALDVHLIVHRAARLIGIAEAGTDLHALDGLDGHHRAREPRVEPTIPLDMRAESDWHAAHDDLERAAERIARRHRLADARLHPLLRLRVAAIELRLRPADAHDIDMVGIDSHAADLRDMGDHVDAERAQEFLAERTDRDAHRRLPRTRALEDIADIAARVFLAAREVGMTRARRRDRLSGRRAERRHAVRPVREITVHDAQRDGAAQRLPETHAGENFRPVLLDLHTAAAPVALLAPRQVAVDRLDIQRKPRRQSLQDGRQTGAVRLSCRQEA